MKKTLRDELLRIQDLEANIKAAERTLGREKARLEALQKECSHDIVIVAKVPDPGYSVRARCLFCGERYYSPHSLRELPNTNICIEACYCKKFFYNLEDQIYESIVTEAQIATLKNPDITKQELGEYLQQLLKDN